jgi:hypothetical protein
VLAAHVNATLRATALYGAFTWILCLVFFDVPLTMLVGLQAGSSYLGTVSAILFGCLIVFPVWIAIRLIRNRKKVLRATDLLVISLQGSLAYPWKGLAAPRNQRRLQSKAWWPRGKKGAEATLVFRTWFLWAISLIVFLGSCLVAASLK